MQYKVRFLKQIHANSSDGSSLDKWLYYDMKLAFAPYPGLYVSDGEIEFTIKDVLWRNEKNRFEATVPADMELYDAEIEMRPHRSIDEITKEYVEEGWKIRD